MPRVLYLQVSSLDGQFLQCDVLSAARCSVWTGACGQMPKRALTPQVQSQVAARLRLAVGLMDTVEIGALSTEYDIRNSLSRLYYAFFHMGLALLLSSGWDIRTVSKDHGKFQSAMHAGAGKYVGTFIRKLYRFRLLCDYDEAMFQRDYGD